MIVGVISVRVMTVGVLSVGVLSVGVMTVGVLSVGVMILSRNYKEPENFIQRHSPAKILTVHLPPCCTLPVKCKQCQPVNILLVYWY